eukprot:gnl/Trimastix_PCT/3387.p1 GENE.gnl/Trimastix_PCT/3387~~gnl/Trimastix_PCT/3387.p1  ORF type:complete len:575 (+),score=141.29 gnl/Trimastix_PCT/3387:70-1725(+)
MSYQGETQNLKRHGRGTYHYSNPYFKYVGEWAEGKKHGRGKLLFRNGEDGHYEGDFVQGEIEGQGVRVYANGSRYEGHFVKGERDGVGCFDDAVKKERFTGHWRANKRHGHGRNEYADGSVYEGAWVDHVRCGHGVQRRDRTLYEGEWVDDTPHGQGRLLDAMTGIELTGAFEHGAFTEEPRSLELVAPRPGEAASTLATWIETHPAEIMHSARDLSNAPEGDSPAPVTPLPLPESPTSQRTPPPPLDPRALELPANCVPEHPRPPLLFFTEPGRTLPLLEACVCTAPGVPATCESGRVVACGAWFLPGTEIAPPALPEEPRPNDAAAEEPRSARSARSARGGRDKEKDKEKEKEQKEKDEGRQRVPSRRRNRGSGRDRDAPSSGRESPAKKGGGSGRARVGSVKKKREEPPPPPPPPEEEETSPLRSPPRPFPVAFESASFIPAYVVAERTRRGAVAFANLRFPSGAPRGTYVLLFSDATSGAVPLPPTHAFIRVVHPGTLEESAEAWHAEALAYVEQRRAEEAERQRQAELTAQQAQQATTRKKGGKAR